jgi:hypothetical protein
MEGAMDNAKSETHYPRRRNTNPDPSKAPYTGPERRKSPREEFGSEEEWRRLQQQG